MSDLATVSVERQHGLVWLRWRDRAGTEHSVPFRPAAARDLGVALIEEAGKVKEAT